jgi:Fur family transcriptional regulator, peroxide stress response regulator
METAKTPKEATDYLKKYKIKPSLIRLKVMQYLTGTRGHPNAELIHKIISREIPTLSKTSIYNTLKTFAAAGVVKEIMIEENEIRYDAHIDRHGHFKCVVCGALSDIDLGCLSCAAAEKLKGGKVLDEHIYLKGVCAGCVKKGKTTEEGSKIKAGLS